MSGAALPAFDLEGGLLLALARGLSVAALLSVFGSLLFRAALAPGVLARVEAGETADFERRWRDLFWSSWAVAMLAMLGWLLLQAASMANASSVTAGMAAVPTVLAETQFGHLVLAQLAALLLTALATGRGRRRRWIATGLAATATALQAGHAHAASMYDGPSLLLVSELVHLLAAGAWLGGLLPLLLLVTAVPPLAAADASRRFSPLGVACVLLLAVTAGLQFWELIGGLPGLIGTGYGLMALLKLVLLAALIGLAGRNRFRLTPALATASAPCAKLNLGRSILIETGVGLLVVLAAGVLTNLPPALHVQPVWPFAERLSLVTIEEDADFRLEVIQAGLAVAGALALLVAAALARCVRWPAVALAAMIAWFAGPHLGLLLVEAYPTSFYRSPTGFTTASIAAGAQLYPQHCAACHGTEGRGDGPAAKGLVIPPADLTAGHLWMHSDGEMFWWLSHGIDAPEGGLAMPGFAAVLSDDERWDLIDSIRAHNAGTTMGSTGAWSPPVQAPELQATCGGRTVSLHDLRGRFVRLVIGEAPVAAANPDVVTIIAVPGTTSVNAGVCVADDEAIPLTYSLISGIPKQNMAGTQFLIDDKGWLRAMQHPGASPSWTDARALDAEVLALRAQPVAASSGGDHMNMRM